MRLVNGIGLALAVYAGVSACSTDDLATMNVTVQKKVGNCWARMAGDALAKDYPRIALSSSCGSTDPSVEEGSDRVSVVIDYGVTIDDGKTAPAPTVSVLLDGKATTTGAIVEPSVDGNARFAYVEFLVPQTTASEMRIAISTPSGYAGGVSDAFNVTTAIPTLSISSCANQTACTVVGGTTTSLTISIPGSESQSVILESYLNGLPVSSPQTIAVATSDGDNVTAQTTLLVPFGTLNDDWQLVARLGSSSVTKEIAFSAPLVTATLDNCDKACTKTNGSNVVLTVSAPKALRATQATLRTSVDGVPDAMATQITLPAPTGAEPFLSNTYGLIAPASGKHWQINVEIAGYSAQTIDVGLTPK